jgi:glutathione synthase/RimK-type ligase-like ATP-grasp enzyme
MGDPLDMLAMTDKVATHQRLAREGVLVPRKLGTISSWEDLQALVQRTGAHRLFLKPRYGSSASGMLAYQTFEKRHQITTTVEILKREGKWQLYNSLRLRHYRKVSVLRNLVNLLARDLQDKQTPTMEPPGLHVERWIPKAGTPKGCFDLRVLVVAGQARQVVVRQSRGPFTNLHLGNQRGDLPVIRRLLGEELFSQGLRTCEVAATAFPGALYAGVDLAFPTNGRPPRVLEINAWGDFLPGVLDQGESCYESELKAVCPVQ